MQIVEVDASRWTDVVEVYAAIYEAVGSHYTACNINALLEGIYWDLAYDDLNGTAHCEDYKAKPPYRLRIVGASALPKPIADELATIRLCLADAHAWFRAQYEGRDVVVEFEIA